MDMATVIKKYDLDLSTVLSEEGIKKLSTAFESLVETLKSDSETQQNREKQIRDEIKHEYQDAQTRHLPEIREMIASVLDLNMDLSVILVEELQQLKTDVMIMRDYHVAAIARERKPERVVGDEAKADRKKEAETLRDTINSVWSLMGKPTGLDFLKVKKSDKTGELLLDLPRIPGGNETGNVGRGAVVRQMRFNVDGNDLPAGTLFYDMIQNYINNFAKGAVLKVTDVKEIIENAGFEFAPKGYDNRWTVELNGRTVSGWVPEDK